ncbi:MAG: hypothetical protein K2N81_09665 [Acetatifactor sp.]|nr:hypothetical protein [Acetatifactor sp.]
MKKKHRKTSPVAETARPNRCYKDTVFRMLFRDRMRLLGLYNAVTGNDYQDPAALEIVTLESAVYLGVKNDIALLIDLNLYLFEHQSTVNPNMPLRSMRGSQRGRIFMAADWFPSRHLILWCSTMELHLVRRGCYCGFRMPMQVTGEWRRKGRLPECRHRNWSLSCR